MADERVIEFFFDVGSPYSYLAATQIGGIGGRTGAEVRWRPFLLGGVFKDTGNEMPARVPSKARYMLADLARWGEHYGVPIRVPPSRFPLSTLAAQRALTSVALSRPEKVPDFALGLFRAYWADDRDVSQPDVVSDVAGACGLDGPAVLAASGQQETKDALRRWTGEAVERGAFGAPSIFVGDSLYWGNDRLDLLERNLQATA